MGKFQSLWNKSNHTFSCQYLSSQNRPVHEIMWKNMAGTDRSRTTIQHDACALHAG